MAIALENEVIVGLAVRIKIQHVESIDTNSSAFDTVHDYIHIFMNIGWTHDILIDNLVEVFEYMKHANTAPDNESLKVLFNLYKDGTYDDFHKRFQRGFITNKRLFVNRQDAWQVAANANQLSRKPTDKRLSVGNNLYSDNLSSSISELRPNYNKAIKEVDSFKFFDCVVIDRHLEFKAITSTDSRDKNSKVSISTYEPHIKTLIQGML